MCVMYIVSLTAALTKHVAHIASYMFCFSCTVPPGNKVLSWFWHSLGRYLSTTKGKFTHLKTLALLHVLLLQQQQH